MFWEVPSRKRSGHGDLGSIIEEAESAKVKKSMRAETQIGKIEVMKAVRGEEWNMNSNPVVVRVKYELVVKHDFESG